MSASLLMMISMLLAAHAVAEQSLAPSSLMDLKAAHQQVLDRLNVKGPDGRAMELDDERVPGLVEEGWQLAGAWAAAYIEAHPAARTKALEKVFEDFAPKLKGIPSPYGNFLVYKEYHLEGSALRVGPGVYVVEAWYGVEFGTGTFIVVARGRDGRFAALWNIKDLAKQHYAQRDEIGRWMHLVGRAYYNGPLNVAKIVPLPLSANGHPRFLVDAYQAADGGTALAQLSIWEWDGASANPLLVEAYEYARALHRVQFDGRIVRIATKERLLTMSTCGMCQDPQGVWSLRVTKSGVENLGRRFLQPEFEWADDLLSEFNEGPDVNTLASSKVIEALKARLREKQEERRELRPQSHGFSLGLLVEWKVLHHGKRGGAFLVAGIDTSLQFTYEIRHGRPHFTSVEIQ